MKSIDIPQEFELYFSESEKPIILDFYTDTCNPCKTLMPILERLSLAYKNEVIFLKTKANENVLLAKQLGVVAIPTLIFVNKNKEIERSPGLITEHSLKQKIEDLLRLRI